MQPTQVEEIAIAINEKLDNFTLSQSDPEKSYHCIYRVHNELRMVNEKAYDPVIIAIGPYHRGNEKLKMMEEHKYSYLKSVLDRGNKTLENYIEAMRSLEKSARKCYAESPNLDANDFIQMLVFDGCFIVELLHRFNKPFLRKKNDPIFVMDWILGSLQRDLMLFENQIPFDVLSTLFDMIKVPELDIDIKELALRFFSDLFPGPGHCQIADDICQTKHLLGLIHDNWLPLFAGQEPPKDAISGQSGSNIIQSVTELIEAGVKFEQADEETCQLHIGFRDGKIQIPRLIVEDRTESFFRNLIAYELYCQDMDHCHIISYTKVLDCLIESPTDVEILCRYKIIENWLGDNDAVSEIFNKINYAVTIPTNHFHYNEIFNEVNAHCSRRVNRWMAKLMRKHLNSPCGVISILAAFVLLLLALIQSICAIISDK